MQDFELRLIGHGSPDGQVIAQDAAQLGDRRSRTLATRLAKVAADRTRPGRSEACLEALSRVRLSGLLAGSTRIAFSLGDANALPIDHPVSVAVETAFWEVITGMVEGHPPPNLPDTVTTATWDLIGALTHAAPVVEVIQAGRGPVRIRTAEVNRAAWEVVATPGASHETYHGRLEMLDLSTSTFAIRDGAGHLERALPALAPFSTTRSSRMAAPPDGQDGDHFRSTELRTAARLHRGSFPSRLPDSTPPIG